MQKIPQRWSETTIGDVCQMTNGKVFKPSDWAPAGLPIIRIQNLNANEAPFNYYDGPVEGRFHIKAGDLLFAWSGTPGTSFGAHIWNGPDAVLNQHIFKLNFDRAAIDPEFLRDAINETLEEQESNAHGGVGIRHVTRQVFSNTRIPFPSRAEQARISRLLNRLRARVEVIRKALDETNKMAAVARLAVLQSAFEGELTREWIKRGDQLESLDDLLRRTPAPEQTKRGREATTEVVEGRAGISVNVPSVALPKDWQWIPLSRLARQETGHTPSRRHPEYWGGEIPWLGIPDANLHHGMRVHSTLQSITPDGLKNSSARLLPEGTVCLSRTASVGYVTILGADMATSQDFVTWTCGSALLPEYLMYALMSEGPGIRRFGAGSVHTTIYFPEIRAFHIRLAPLAEQQEIVRIVSRMLRQIENLERTTQQIGERIEDLRRRISAWAFAGRLTAEEDGDGTASAELAAVTVPVLAKADVSQVRKSRRGSAMVKTIESVLKEAGSGLPAQEAFRLCGIAAGAEIEALEQIFADLRTLEKEKRLLVEPILDDSGRKIEDRLQLVGTSDAA